jgi:hypothetical protein
VPPAERNASIALDERQTWEEADEVDVTIDWARETQFRGRSLSFSAGYVAYLTPSGETEHTEEFYATASADYPASPAVEAYYDFVEGECWYLSPSVSYEWPDPGITLSASAGFSDADQPFGFHGAEATASLAWSKGSFTFGPTLGASAARESIDPKQGRVFGLFGVHWAGD